MDEVALGGGDLHPVRAGLADPSGSLGEPVDDRLDLTHGERSAVGSVPVEQVEAGGCRHLVGRLAEQAGLGMRAGIADLDDVLRPQRLHPLHPGSQRGDELVLADLGVLDRRPPPVVDGEGGRHDRADPALGEPLLEVRPGLVHRPVVVGQASADGGAHQPVRKGDAVEGEWFEDHARTSAPARDRVRTWTHPSGSPSRCLYAESPFSDGSRRNRAIPTNLRAIARRGPESPGFCSLWHHPPCDQRILCPAGAGRGAGPSVGRCGTGPQPGTEFLARGLSRGARERS